MSYLPLSAVQANKTPKVERKCIPSCFMDDEIAANESISSGIYVTWVPNPLKIDPDDEFVADDVRGDDAVGQCCRVGAASVCLCGHTLADHLPNISIPRKLAYIKPPGCSGCGGADGSAATSMRKCKCPGFRYCPSRPEECGQFWLLQRKDFNLEQWRQVCGSLPIHAPMHFNLGNTVTS